MKPKTIIMIATIAIAGVAAVVPGCGVTDSAVGTTTSADTVVDAGPDPVPELTALEATLNAARVPVPTGCTRVFDSAPDTQTLNLARGYCAVARKMFADTAATYGSEVTSGDPDQVTDFQTRILVVNMALEGQLLNLAGGAVDDTDGGLGADAQPLPLYDPTLDPNQPDAGGADNLPPGTVSLDGGPFNPSGN